MIEIASLSLLRLISYIDHSEPSYVQILLALERVERDEDLTYEVCMDSFLLLQGFITEKLRNERNTFLFFKVL